MKNIAHLANNCKQTNADPNTDGIYTTKYKYIEESVNHSTVQNGHSVEEYSRSVHMTTLMN